MRASTGGGAAASLRERGGARATAWSAAAAVASEGEGEAKNGESRSITGECGRVLAHWSPTWPDQAGGRRCAAPHGDEALLPVRTL